MSYGPSVRKGRGAEERSTAHLYQSNPDHGDGDKATIPVLRERPQASEINLTWSTMRSTNWPGEPETCSNWWPVSIEAEQTNAYAECECGRVH